MLTLMPLIMLFLAESVLQDSSSFVLKALEALFL